MSSCAVVILNWNGMGFLEDFLPSVVRHSGSATVVVADNGSTDGSVDLLREKFTGSIEVIELEENYGFAGGYNRALQRLRGRFDYYILLNSDVEVTEGWIEPIVEILDTQSNTVAVQPKILSYGHRDHFEYAGASGGFIDIMGFPFCRGRLINSCEEDRGQYDDVREIFWASGAAFAVRSEPFHTVGGFDDSFFAHMEEIDLCWRLKRAGYAIKVCPQSTVYHLGAGTLPVWSPKKTYLNFRNNVAMLYKNLPKGRFALIYTLRFGTDMLRMMSYFFTGKFDFSSAIARAHRDFWRARKSYDQHPELPNRPVSQIYQGSIILYYIFTDKKFNNIL